VGSLPGPVAGQEIEISGLSKHFGAVPAVDRLTFSAAPGEVTGFLGPNGAGKTTTLRMLLGLVEPSAGIATIGGRHYRDLEHPATTIGAALETGGFHPSRTGRNHLRVYCTVNQLPDGRADDVLDQVGLTGAADRRVRQYSLGMRQRLALATALLGDPPVLVLDEPSNGLDPAGIAWLRGLVRRLADEGRTLLVSSHDLSEVQLFADQVVIVDHGTLVRAGRLDELTAGGEVLVVTPDADRFAAILSDQGAQLRRDGAGALLVTGLERQRVGRLAHDHRVELHALELRQNGLEELFFALTRGAEDR
jgi:ABC-2 type transport system ATP-binding protein